MRNQGITSLIIDLRNKNEQVEYRIFGEEPIQAYLKVQKVDKDTNSRISNNYFDTKRRELVKAEKEGLYIPICTKNVFLKSKSKT